MYSQKIFSLREALHFGQGIQKYRSLIITVRQPVELFRQWVDFYLSGKASKYRKFQKPNFECVFCAVCLKQQKSRDIINKEIAIFSALYQVPSFSTSVNPYLQCQILPITQKILSNYQIGGFPDMSISLKCQNSSASPERK